MLEVISVRILPFPMFSFVEYKMAPLLINMTIALIVSSQTNQNLYVFRITSTLPKRSLKSCPYLSLKLLVFVYQSRQSPNISKIIDAQLGLSYSERENTYKSPF